MGEGPYQGLVLTKKDSKGISGELVRQCQCEKHRVYTVLHCRSGN